MSACYVTRLIAKIPFHFILKETSKTKILGYRKHALIYEIIYYVTRLIAKIPFHFIWKDTSQTKNLSYRKYAIIFKACCQLIVTHIDSYIHMLIVYFWFYHCVVCRKLKRIKRRQEKVCKCKYGLKIISFCCYSELFSKNHVSYVLSRIKDNCEFGLIPFGWSSKGLIFAFVNQHMCFSQVVMI